MRRTVADLEELLNFKYEQVQVFIHPFLWTAEAWKLDAKMELLCPSIVNSSFRVQVVAGVHVPVVFLTAFSSELEGEA